MYYWRKLTEDEREELIELRKARRFPWHSPPHRNFTVAKQYLLSSSCYNHVSVIGKDPERMNECESEVLRICESLCSSVYAWCILPNHYHVLVKTNRIQELLEKIGEFHGRSSFEWNRADNQPGRKVWYNCFERAMKSERHFWATLNYVHHNPVHHGYVKRWTDWPWSSAREYLERVGAEEAKRTWLQYPILDYGKKWDV